MYLRAGKSARRERTISAARIYLLSHQIGATDHENAGYAEPKIRGKNMNAMLNSEAV